jgi:hypothetical protein
MAGRNKRDEVSFAAFITEVILVLKKKSRILNLDPEIGRTISLKLSLPELSRKSNWYLCVCIFLISIDLVTLTAKVCGVQKKETVLCGSYYFSVLKIFDYVETHLNSECKLPSVERSCQLSRAFRYDRSLTSRSQHWSEFSIWTSITGTSFTRLHR